MNTLDLSGQAHFELRKPRRRAWIAGAVLAVAAIAARNFDLGIADALFYDRLAQAWIGAHSWWAVNLVYQDGAWFVRFVGLAALVIATVGKRVPRLEHWRRGAAYVALAVVLCRAAVAALKQVTNVDCPRDLAHFGGDRPDVGLFSDRPDSLPRASCYPGSHSSSGFALIPLYFVLLDRPASRAWDPGRGRAGGYGLLDRAGGPRGAFPVT